MRKQLFYFLVQQLQQTTRNHDHKAFALRATTYFVINALQLAALKFKTFF
jgi:hypothetical protein